MLGIAGVAAIAILLAADLYLIAVHVGNARRRLMDEAAAIARPAAESRVCVQLPVFNEAALVGPAIDALCALEWPRDRLQVLVPDDSDDETSAIVAQRVAYWRARGIDVAHLQRASRVDFKAGALAAATAHTMADYVAIFDVDYRPAPSFLKQTMTVLLADPGLAFVQARIDYRNRATNWLTRAQALELDMLQSYEHAARHWAGIPTTFSGTCGVWRRAAIEQAGGWSGDTLAEDQDLSFRAFARGWRSRNLLTVSASGELPESFTILAAQRRRWSAGTAQAYQGLPWRLLRRLRWDQATIFVLLVQFHASIALLLGATLALAVATSLFDAGRGLGLAIGLAVVVAALVISKTVGAALARRVVGGFRLGSFASDVAWMWLMEIALLPVVGHALITGYLSRRLPFRRTPKTGR